MASPTITPTQFEADIMPAQEQIAERAYQIWEAKVADGDEPHGHDQDHWFQAIDELVLERAWRMRVSSVTSQS